MRMNSLEQTPLLTRRGLRIVMRILAYATVIIVALVMLQRSWATWPDCTIDFGRELYTPWQLSEGRVLYRDIVSYFNGPFTPYLHALIFKLFGVGLRTLVLFN